MRLGTKRTKTGQNHGLNRECEVCKWPVGMFQGLRKDGFLKK